MSPEQASHFRQHGYLSLRGALTRKQLAPIREHVLGELKKVGSRSLKAMPAFQQIGKLGQAIKYPGLQKTVVTPALRSALDELAGSRLVPAQEEAQLLTSPPNQGVWTLDRLNWHVDLSSPRKEIPGIQVFVLIDDVAPRGGATMAVAGSHLLDSHEEAAKVRGLLRNGSGVETGLRSLGLSLLEMSGRAGDAYLMDMRVLHTPSINSTKSARIMATARYLVKG